MGILGPRMRFFQEFALLVMLLSMTSTGYGESTSNETVTSLEETEDDAPLSDMTLAEFKERYRRLIPYMTFYVANNYVTPQPIASQDYAQEQQPTASPLIQRRPQHPLLTRLTVPRRGGSGYRINPPSQDKKFIPSVQYNPREIGGDNDYFTPVRYTNKINYEDYGIPTYQVYQGHKPVYTEITTPTAQISQPENRYYANARPLRPYVTTGVRDYPRKQSAKPIHPAIPEDYILDYVSRPNLKTIPGAVGHNYRDPANSYQYIPPAIPQASLQQVHNILQAIPGRHSVLSQGHRNPTINLNHITESLQLTERLPDTLNKDNIDSSIKTLVEILNILHNTRKEEFPELRATPLPPQARLPTPTVLSRRPQKVAAYENATPRPYTRPKVITETRFQVTPNPLMITDDPERFKVQPTYVEDVKAEIVQQPDYDVNNLGGEKVVEYYTPHVQDIPVEENKKIFLPTVRPPAPTASSSSTQQHSYEITEDLSDDILDNGRYGQTSTTEKIFHSSARPNEVTPPPRATNVPRTSLKYGVTRGKPNVDYPAYAIIPETTFSCKEQRYKGFFGDPSTGCQVWHYCDLNGGKASFLCPNGTIFSQVALTCDWWFNVKCESTTQLYVLNERLYKYILPIMPKFPEDFTGPEVDRYLELKFKEMEAKLKEKKLKKQQEGKDKLKAKHQPQNNNE